MNRPVAQNLITFLIPTAAGTTTGVALGNGIAVDGYTADALLIGPGTEDSSGGGDFFIAVDPNVAGLAKMPPVWLNGGASRFSTVSFNFGNGVPGRSVTGQKDGLDAGGVDMGGVGGISPKITPGLLGRMLRRPLIPRPDNFTPEERTPWGGVAIRDMKSRLGLAPAESTIVGESWEISGHPKFPNRYAVDWNGEGSFGGVPFAKLSDFDAVAFFGAENVGRFGRNMPFLTKLLNSGSWEGYKIRLRKVLEGLESDKRSAGWKRELGCRQRLSDILGRNYHDIHMALTYLETQRVGAANSLLDQLYAIHSDMLAKNLSVQIHPPAGYKKDAPSKTEAWYIIDAEEGAGIYLGLKDGVAEGEMRARLEAGEDITPLMNFIEVRAGEAFYIPAGTPHAIGAGILLYEPQETSETTFRYYDWAGRGRGKPRELHVDDALAVTMWDGLRGEALVGSLRREPNKISGDGVREDLFVDEPEFRFSRISFRPGDVYQGGYGLQGLTVIKGRVSLFSGDGGTFYGDIPQGQSVVIPAAMSGYRLVVEKVGEEAVVLRTTVGDGGDEDGR